ncbi:MAG TPA: hypothetical protein VEY51_12175, partial [Chondromyces sp.]|nr:hypothetical protein [Chondromyces sp.]
MTEKSVQDQMKQMERDLLKLEGLYKLFDEEREKMSKLNHMDLREIVVFKQMLKSLQQGWIVLEDIDAFYFRSKPTAEENQLFDQQLEHLVKCHELFLLKYGKKIKMDEPRLEDDTLKETRSFLEEVIYSSHQGQEQKIQLAVIAASIYNYAFQIDRLDRLVERYIKKS